MDGVRARRLLLRIISAEVVAQHHARCISGDIESHVTDSADRSIARTPSIPLLSWVVCAKLNDAESFSILKA
jgi:hypothetical protein